MTREGETATEQVVYTIAETTATNPLELPPLYDTIDPDVLDTLVETMTNGTISFTYIDHDITVHSDGTITINDPRTDNPTPGPANSD